MLKNHLKVGLRHLLRRRGDAYFNVLGLAIGLACGILIFLFVQRELSYDTFHENADRIYRLTYDASDVPGVGHLATTSPPMGPALLEEYAQVERFVRLRKAGRDVFAHGAERHYEDSYFYADSSFFEVFGFDLAQGNPETALDAANSAVLTPETARKYFGSTNPVGRTLRMNDEREITVTGVLGPLASNSHLRFDLLLSFSTFRVPAGYPVTLDDWRWGSFHTYLLLRQNADPETLEAQLPAFMTRHFDAERAERVHLRLQPVTDIYLGEPKSTDVASGRSSYMVGLSGAAFLILLLACFNFANLSTAQSMRRSREVGVRKALGASRSNLLQQYLGESFLVALFAFLVAAVLAYGAAVVGNRWLDLRLSASFETLLPAALVFMGVAVIAGLLAGAYPAFVISSFRPATVFKGDTPRGVTGGRIRDALVIGQFAIAIGLAAASFIVARQMEYVETKELGFDDGGVIALFMQGDDLLTRYDVLRETLEQNPHVERVTKAGDLFDGNYGSVPIVPEGADDERGRPMNIFSMHYDFMETLGIEVVEGRAPSRTFGTDSADAVVLNESAARLLESTVPGWSDPIGMEISVGDIMDGQVIGVVEDFHYASLHTEIEPLVLYFPRANVDKVLVRVAPGNISETLASLESDWEAVVPDFPFTYEFLDEHVGTLYRADRRFSRIIGIFTVLTIIVACMGLYGLVAFIAQLRTKEIGIRKVLGATVPGIVGLLSRRFVAYGLIANVVAWPIAYLGIRRWLENFAYHVEPGVGTFALAGLATLLLALLATSYESVKAAMIDPARSLRQE